MQSRVVKRDTVATQELGEGVSRKVLAHLPELMVVEVRFEAGAVGNAHRHAHTQATYVQSGAFTFTVEGERHDVTQGDTLVFAPNELHGCLCRQQGTLVDVFTPQREDFLS